MVKMHTTIIKKLGFIKKNIVPRCQKVKVYKTQPVHNVHVDKKSMKVAKRKLHSLHKRILHMKKANKKKPSKVLKSRIASMKKQKKAQAKGLKKLNKGLWKKHKDNRVNKFKNSAIAKGKKTMSSFGENDQLSRSYVEKQNEN